MADSDPISEATPRKRQKLDVNGRQYDSQDDSGDELTSDDFYHPTTNTTAAIPAAGQKRKPVGYSVNQFHADVDPNSSQQTNRYITQPTQTLRTTTATQNHPHHRHHQSNTSTTTTTQPTQPILPRTSSPPASEVLVDRSSPTQSSPPPRQIPPPIRRAPFAKPGLLASAMAPPGTTFRRPLGVPSRPTIPPVDDSDDEDPPVNHSSDDDQETQSALKPTHFKQGGSRMLAQGENKTRTTTTAASTPGRSSDSIVRESPRPNGTASNNGGSAFLNLMSEFGFGGERPMRSPDDSASAYASASRRPRPALSSSSTTMNPQSNKTTRPPRAIYKTIEDVPDWTLRRKVISIRDIVPHESVQRCMDALIKNKGNVDDAMTWLTDHEEGDEPSSEVDELASLSPVPKRGVAVSKAYNQSQSSQPPRQLAKQEVKAPTQTIAEKYRAIQPHRRLEPTQQQQQQQQRETIAISDDEEEEEELKQPKRRLQQGRKPGRKSPTPTSSPPVRAPLPSKPAQKVTTVVLSDDESNSEAENESEEDETVTAGHQDRLLRFFNECSVRDIVDLCNQPEAIVKQVLDHRPFASLDVIREISLSTETKSGKKSRARPIGDKLVDDCGEMRRGFDAVGELVDECERIAKPIQNTLKGWGVSTSNEGELQLMNLEDTHDSGIGTPASSDDLPVPQSSRKKSNFLTQPESMNSEMKLKDYQLVGLNWLNLLWSKKISCILADDMGLGKTCQIIAFLAHLQEQGVDGVHLIIVPGSTLENWIREFARFAPKLTVQTYYGSQKERAELRETIEAEFNETDVVITTYDTAVKKEDNHFLRKRIDPLVTVYDEAHQLRNTQTERYQQLIRIPAEFRVLLTGTPLQNNLQELVAILAFIMPEIFDQKREELQYIFKHKASTKDADHAALLSSQRIARARSMITPFILRRKKHQVLDLPAKHRRVEWCDMTPNQAEYYNSLLEDLRRAYAARLEGGTNNKNTKTGTTKKAVVTTSSTTIMTLREVAIHPLLRLRIYDDRKLKKIATELLKREWAGNPRDRVLSYLRGEHPQSFKGGDFGLHRFCAERSEYLSRFMLKERDWMDSGKVSKFSELITAFAKKGDRVLVFSQFTSNMDILEAVLDTLGIRFLRLDGSTDMNIRQDLIDTFHNDATIPVFMLSTRAGGAGVNLACANKVIIFDSGFNPQDDIQAENRAHRVGQTREVEVVRLVTRDSIEVQIHGLGESKLALDDRVSAGGAADGAGAGDGDGAPAAAQESGGGKGGEEESGRKKVEEMFLESLKNEGNCSAAGAAANGGIKTEREEAGPKQEGDDRKVNGKARPNEDLRDAFKVGLENAGVKVRSKQARL